MLLNNVCESFNSSILDAREKLFLTMLEWIRGWMMVRFQRHMDISNLKWNRRIFPRIKKILDKHAEKKELCIHNQGNQWFCFMGREVGRPTKARRREFDEPAQKSRKMSKEENPQY
ncbi:hypothetical protein ACS0TY_005575 [Phlomoides rotata]